MVTSIKIADKNEKNIKAGKKIADIVDLLTNQLIGETCKQVRFSYGDELCLHFGEMISCQNPKLEDQQKGSWRFGARATPWFLKQTDRLLIDERVLETDAEIENAKQLTQKSLTDKQILKLAINPVSLNLQLCFEENYELMLQPDLEEDSDLAYWELFMPTEQILEIGPGYFWSCKSIHDRC
jgi:hypothetical protein